MEKKTKLDPRDYWEWRTTVTELDLATSQLKLQQLETLLLTKEQEINQFKLMLSRQKMSTVQHKWNEIKEEYDNFKKKLECKIGMFLKECTIDGVTFEVTQLDTPVKEN